MKGYIGLDFATQSARAIIIGEDGRILTRFTTDLEPVKIVDKSRTQNPESWVKALIFLLQGRTYRAGNHRNLRNLSFN